MKNPEVSSPVVLQPMSDQEMETYRLHRRFDRMGRLIGDAAIARLFRSHVMVIGIGGVGSWAAEALMRSGVGTVSLVDFDEICVTNTNRQLPALTRNIGEKKAEVMATRLREINPGAEIIVHTEFYNAKSAETLFARKPDYVVDAIDNITAKCHLIAFCRDQGIPIVSSTGSGGRFDPTQIRVKDLSETEVDPLAKSVRRILKQQYGFPENGNFGVKAVYSPEQVREPLELSYDGGKGFRCVCPGKAENNLHSCEHRNVILGTASFVTGTFGLTCASVVVRELSGAGN